MFSAKNPFEPPVKKRATIRAEVKKAVFERAKGQCESRNCNKNLKWGSRGTGTRGVFHHTRSPSISPTEKTVRLVCPDCHSNLHEIKTRTKNHPLIGQTKERVVVRKDTKRKVKQVRKKGLSKRKQIFQVFQIRHLSFLEE